MKKKFESPKMETAEFAVAARLATSGATGGHDNSPDSTCAKASSNGGNSCAAPSLSTSGPDTGNCSV